MTNTQQIFMNQRFTDQGREFSVQALTDTTQAIVRSRISDREIEAANARLAAGGRRRSAGKGLRPAVGRVLIRIGRTLAPEAAGARAGRPASQRAFGAR